jgi:hypothetical protein
VPVPPRKHRRGVGVNLALDQIIKTPPSSTAMADETTLDKASLKWGRLDSLAPDRPGSLLLRMTRPVTWVVGLST